MNISCINHMKVRAAAMAIIMMAVYGCSDKTPTKPVKQAAPAKAVQSVTAPASPEVEAAMQEMIKKMFSGDMAAHEGYVYQQRDRRDPFVPLVVATKQLGGVVQRETGTLESYDISEFKLSAIATKGKEYYALLVAPDNRSFTVDKGTVIGLSKGKVNQILRDRVILVEYSKNFRGESKERQIILEFRKGETK